MVACGVSACERRGGPGDPLDSHSESEQPAAAIVGMTELLAAARVRWKSMDTSPLSARAKAMLAAGIFLSA